MSKLLAIDCEMVGSGNKHLLARVALVNDKLITIYDKYVAPTDQVTDYRTGLSGITANHLRNAPSFAQVQREVRDLISGCVLIGHSVQDVDLMRLGLSHPEVKIRDVAQYPPFRQHNYGQKPSLKDLAEKELGKRIQTGPHDAVEDAKTAMQLYLKVAHQWH